jgi:hypothetical protein
VVRQAAGAANGYGDLGTRRDAEDMRFATDIWLDWVYNLDVTARILLNGDFTFCPICDFNGLSRGEGSHSTTFARSLHDKLWPTA